MLFLSCSPTFGPRLMQSLPARLPPAPSSSLSFRLSVLQPLAAPHFLLWL